MLKKLLVALMCVTVAFCAVSCKKDEAVSSEKTEGNGSGVFDPEGILFLHNILFVHLVGIFGTDDLNEIDEFHAAVIRNAGTNLENLLLLTLVLSDILQKLRPGADEAHFAQEHLAQLRDLIQLGLAQEIAHLGDPGIPQRGGTAADFVGIFHHAAELEYTEAFTMQPSAFGTVEHGESAFQSN